MNATLDWVRRYDPTRLVNGPSGWIDFEGLEQTYLGLMDRLAPLVRQGLSGSVYTQTTDVELEVNGLLTYDRRVLKVDAARIRAAHEKVCAALGK